MQFTYELTLQDYISAQYLHKRAKLGTIYYALCYWIVPSLSVPFAALLLISHFREGSEDRLPLVALVGCLFMAFSPVYYYFQLRRAFVSTRISTGVSHIRFSDENILWETPEAATSIVEWVALKQVRENKRVLLLYLSKASFIVLPKTAMHQAEGQLRSLLQSKMSHGV